MTYSNEAIFEILKMIELLPPALLLIVCFKRGLLQCFPDWRCQIYPAFSTSHTLIFISIYKKLRLTHQLSISRDCINNMKQALCASPHHHQRKKDTRLFSALKSALAWLIFKLCKIKWRIIGPWTLLCSALLQLLCIALVHIIDWFWKKNFILMPGWFIHK
jgi:uncharacterized membrane protein YoaK (UPF0700 family)